MTEPDDHYGSHEHELTAGESSHDAPMVPDLPELDHQMWPLGEDYRENLEPSPDLDHEPARSEREAGVEHSGHPGSLSPEAVPGPSWPTSLDPFADHDAAAGIEQVHDGTAPYPPTFVDALGIDYAATWTAAPADHSPPVWDGETSALLAHLMPHPGGGVDAALLRAGGQSPDEQARELWREGLPDEALPVGPDGLPLPPVAMLDELIGRLADPAQADVARVMREGLAQ